MMKKLLVDDLFICRLLELFFILSFTNLTYKYNLYILIGFIPFLFILRKRLYIQQGIFIIFFALLILLYFCTQELTSVVRIFKTVIVLTPFFFHNIIKRQHYQLSSLFDIYMTINALLVCVDFILYFVVGTTIMNFTIVGGIFPRPCGLAEDSNFFSYLMLIYIFYKKWKFGSIGILYPISLFLSGSMSAIAFFFIILISTKLLGEINRNIFLTRNIIIVGSIISVITYDVIAINSDVLLDYLWSIDLNSYLKLKLISLSQRLNTISNSMEAMKSFSDVTFGIGAGMTRELSEAGLNMHNSLLQLFLEMGLFLLIPISIIVIKMAYSIYNLKWLVLFCSMLILGLIMETLYSPFISLVFFLSYANVKS